MIHLVPKMEQITEIDMSMREQNSLSEEGVTKRKCYFSSKICHYLSRFCVPQRYVLAVMGCLFMFLIQMFRMNLVIAIVRMANRSLTVEDEKCNSLIDEENEIYPYDWTASIQNRLLEGFSFGYLLTNIPGGFFSEKYGGKVVIIVNLLVASTCICLSQLVIAIGGSTAFRILQVVMGMSCGLSFPAIMVMVTRWVPKDERATLSAIIYGGTFLGHAIIPYFGEFILNLGEWYIIFYVFGAFGYMYSILWYCLCYSTPNDHPFVSEDEKTYLNDNLESLIRINKYNSESLPWGAVIRCGPLLTAILALIGYQFGWLTIVTYFPTFLSEIYGYDIKPGTLIYSSGFLSLWVSSIIFGVISDFGIQRGLYSKLKARKIFSSIGILGPALCISIGVFSGSYDVFAVIMYFSAMMLLGAFYSGAWINILDLTPNYTGSLIGLSYNLSINLARILIPLMFDLIVNSSSLWQFQVAHNLVNIVMLATIVVYIVYAGSEQVWWDDVKLFGYPAGWKHGYFETSAKLVVDERGYYACTCHKKRNEPMLPSSS